MYRKVVVEALPLKSLYLYGELSHKFSLTLPPHLNSTSLTKKLLPVGIHFS